MKYLFTEDCVKLASTVLEGKEVSVVGLLKQEKTISQGKLTFTMPALDQESEPKKLRMSVSMAITPKVENKKSFAANTSLHVFLEGIFAINDAYMIIMTPDEWKKIKQMQTPSWKLIQNPQSDIVNSIMAPISKLLKS